MYQVVLFMTVIMRDVFSCVCLYDTLFPHSLLNSKCFCILIFLHIQCIHGLITCILCGCCLMLKQGLWSAWYWGHMLLSHAVYVCTCGIIDRQIAYAHCCFTPVFPFHASISPVYTWTATVKHACMLCVLSTIISRPCCCIKQLFALLLVPKCHMIITHWNQCSYTRVKGKVKFW
jgi:hypothetical protein